MRGILGFPDSRYTEHLVKIALVGLLFLAVFYPAYPHLLARFNARDSYYSHGFLIPLISLFLAWRKREKLLSLPARPLIAGLFIFLAGLILHLLSFALKINFGSYMAILVTLSGLILYLGGKEHFRELFFPVSFLMFMVPLPKVVIIGISFKMKLLVAQMSALFINTIGISASREGSTIYLPQGYLVVGDPCSGLRSLISFFALGFLFTQFTRAPRAKKTMLVASTIPIALLSNMIRIVFLCIVTYLYGEEVAMGFVHDASGVMVFVLGFIGFIGVSKLLKCDLTTDTT
jgi:exosortase